MENRKIFIGNLSFTASVDDVTNLLSVYGLVKEITLSKKKGCAVVEMSDLSESEEVIRRLNKSEFMGRPLLVEFQMPPKKAKELAAKRFAQRGKKLPDGKSRDSSEKSPRTRNQRPFAKSEDSENGTGKLPGTRFTGHSTGRFKKPLPADEFKRKEKAAPEFFDQGDFSFLESPDGELKSAPKRTVRKAEPKTEFTAERPERKPRSAGFKPGSYEKKSRDGQRNEEEKPKRSTKNRPAKNRKTGAELRLERKAKTENKKWFGDDPRPKKKSK